MLSMASTPLLVYTSLVSFPHFSFTLIFFGVLAFKLKASGRTPAWAPAVRGDAPRIKTQALKPGESLLLFPCLSSWLIFLIPLLLSLSTISSTLLSVSLHLSFSSPLPFLSSTSCLISSPRFPWLFSFLLLSTPLFSVCHYS